MTTQKALIAWLVAIYRETLGQIAAMVPRDHRFAAFYEAVDAALDLIACWQRGEAGSRKHRVEAAYRLSEMNAICYGRAKDMSVALLWIMHCVDETDQLDVLAKRAITCMELALFLWGPPITLDERDAQRQTWRDRVMARCPTSDDTREEV